MCFFFNLLPPIQGTVQRDLKDKSSINDHNDCKREDHATSMSLERALSPTANLVVWEIPQTLITSW